MDHSKLFWYRDEKTGQTEIYDGTKRIPIKQIVNGKTIHGFSVKPIFTGILSEEKLVNKIQELSA